MLYPKVSPDHILALCLSALKHLQHSALIPCGLQLDLSILKVSSKHSDSDSSPSSSTQPMNQRNQTRTTSLWATKMDQALRGGWEVPSVSSPTLWKVGPALAWVRAVLELAG